MLATFGLEDSILTEPAFSVDGRLLAAADAHNRVGYIWDTNTRREVGRIPGLTRAMAFSPDGTLVAGGTADFHIMLWSLSAQPELATLSGHKWQIFQIAFSPDGKRLASASIDNTARLWDVSTHREIAVLQGHQSGIHCLAFSPDGQTIATGSTDETVRLWSVATGQQLLTIRSYQQDPGRILFAPDGNSLAVGMYRSANRTPMFIRRLPTLQEIDRIEMAKRAEH